MEKYLEFISESRYKTHGLNTIKRQLKRILGFMLAKYKIHYNYDTDDFGIYFTKIDMKTKNLLILTCETIGYFPSIFEVDDDVQKPNSIKTIDDFIEFVKEYEIPQNYKIIYFQFESWLDNSVQTPELLYHVCRLISIDKINRYGLYPKAKHKISYHPDRVYFTSSLIDAKNIIEQFKNINNIDYSIVEIDISKNDFNDVPVHKNLLVRKDPNFESGYYTCQNIPPSWISKIINL